MARAEASLSAGEAAAAAKDFDAVVLVDPLGPLTARALLRGGLAHEQVGDLEASALRFEQLARRFPQSALRSEAMLRSMRVRLHLGQWATAGHTGEAFLERYSDANAAGRIVANAARALALMEAEHLEEAEYFVGQGLSVVDRLALDRAGRLPRDLAVLYFAQGEARRRRAEAVTLTSDVSQFAAVLERRCELLLAAQSAYSDSMRAHDAHWSTLAGYQVGELYGQLHRELVQIPSPRTDTERDRLLFEGAMRLRYSVLLEKALSMLTHTLAMVERTGVSSHWVERTRRSRDSLIAAMETERRVIDRLPFSRDDLRRALDDLGRRASRSAP